MELLDLPTNELKSRLVNEKDFAQIMKFFFDRFVDQRSFMSASRPVRAPQTLIEAVGKVFATVAPKKVIASSWQLCEVGLLNLIHGSVTTKDGLAIVLWATDIKVGLVGMPDMKTGNVLYSRLTVTPAQAAAAN